MVSGAGSGVGRRVSLAIVGDTPEAQARARIYDGLRLDFRGVYRESLPDGAAPELADLCLPAHRVPAAVSALPSSVRLVLLPRDVCTLPTAVFERLGGNLRARCVGAVYRTPLLFCSGFAQAAELAGCGILGTGIVADCRCPRVDATWFFAWLDYLSRVLDVEPARLADSAACFTVGQHSDGGLRLCLTGSNACLVTETMGGGNEAGAGFRTQVYFRQNPERHRYWATPVTEPTILLLAWCLRESPLSLVPTRRQWQRLKACAVLAQRLSQSETAALPHRAAPAPAGVP